jgi:hypothetical protein
MVQFAAIIAVATGSKTILYVPLTLGPRSFDWHVEERSFDWHVEDRQ